MTPSAIAIISVCFAALSLLGGPVAAYVAVRVGLASLQATMTTSLSDIGRRLEKMESARDTHSTDLGALRTKVGEQGVAIKNIADDVERLEDALGELRRKLSGEMHAVTDTGQHQAVRVPRRRDGGE